ncbi:hypothetical protein [Corynebacterium halotolerans]
MSTARRFLPTAWATLLIGLLLWPLFSPGQLALRDMLVLDHPALSPSALGFGNLAARNVPQDGVLAVLGTFAPASWVARGLIVAAAAAGAGGAAWLARRARGGGWATAAAMTVVLWNPFVVERLLQGHWSLVIAAWLLPLIAAAGLSGRAWVAWLAMWLAALTPTGGLFALFTGVATARRHRWWTAGVGVVACLPWIIPGLASASSALSTPESVAAFAPRAEGLVGTLGSLLGLGGIWNADAVPASREVGFAVAGVALFAVLLLGVRRCPPVLLVLGLVGLGGAVAAWLLPEALAWAVSTIPGAGLLRDSQKLVMLALPAYAALAGGLRPRWLAGGALVLALLQVPDAPRALQQLTPVEVQVNEELVAFADGRDVLFVDRPALITLADGRVVTDPYAKALSMVESGALTVDGVLVDPPSERWVAAQEAWAWRDMDTLEELGVGVIVDDDGRVVGTDAQRRVAPLGVALLGLWLLIPVGVLVLRLAGRGGRRGARPRPAGRRAGGPRGRQGGKQSGKSAGKRDARPAASPRKRTGKDAAED